MAQLNRTFSNACSSSGKKARAKSINDPIHGYIDLAPEMLQFMDTPQFQRLRDLKQLGSCYYVFPGASHNRFEHCIGTSYLAGLMISNLQRGQPELTITNDEVLLVKLAGLCHDLGHGPFSHIFDSEFIPRARPGYDWSHEDGSAMMLEHLVTENNIPMDERDLNFLKILIHPTEEQAKTGGRKFLFDIVANSRNSLDVDKFDYIARDCLYLGIKGSSDSSRLVRNCRVIRDEICFHSKEAFNIYEMFHTRYSLFKRVYSHRVAKAIEYMITDALLAADPILHISAAIDDPVEYMKLSDSVLRTIEISSDPSLKPARDIVKRIRCRKLYRLIGEGLLPSTGILTKATEAELVRFQPANGQLKSTDIVVHNMCISYAMKDKNPVDLIHFFDDWDATEYRSIPKEHVSTLIPDKFQERRIRVYIKDPSDEGKVQNAVDALDAFLKYHYPQKSVLTSTPIKRPLPEADSRDTPQPVTTIEIDNSMSPCPSSTYRPAFKRTRSFTSQKAIVFQSIMEVDTLTPLPPGDNPNS